MDDTDKRLRDICREIPALEMIRLEALGLAPSLNGDPERIKEVWRGKEGLQRRIVDALEPLGLVDAGRYNRLYDEACRGLWRLLWAGGPRFSGTGSIEQCDLHKYSNMRHLPPIPTEAGAIPIIFPSKCPADKITCLQYLHTKVE